MRTMKVICDWNNYWSIGAVTIKFEEFVEGIGIDLRVENIQKRVSVGIKRVLRLKLGP